MQTATTTLAPPHRIEPWHDTHDQAKLDALTASMAAHGWQGPAVVAIPGEDHGWGPADPKAITGSHRIAAACEAGIDIPVVWVDDLLAQAGTSLAELDDTYGDPEGDHYEAVVRLSDHLPAEIIDHYGLDAH